MKKRKEDKPWTAHGPMPGREAIIKAYLVLLGHPPVITPEGREAIRREQDDQTTVKIKVEGGGEGWKPNWKF